MHFPRKLDNVPTSALVSAAALVAFGVAAPITAGSDTPADDTPVRAAGTAAITPVAAPAGNADAALDRQVALEPRQPAVAPVEQRTAEEPEPEPAPEEASADEGTGRTISGEASWYGPGFAGNQTANGEIYDPSQLTAAHKTLPFDTRLRVTNLDTGESVVVRINDRGPYAGGRILDLSEAAAEVIGMKSSGVAPVEAEIL